MRNEGGRIETRRTLPFPDLRVLWALCGETISRARPEVDVARFIEHPPRTVGLGEGVLLQPPQALAPSTRKKDRT